MSESVSEGHRSRWTRPHSCQSDVEVEVVGQGNTGTSSIVKTSATPNAKKLMENGSSENCSPNVSKVSVSCIMGIHNKTIGRPFEQMIRLQYTLTATS